MAREAMAWKGTLKGIDVFVANDVKKLFALLNQHDVQAWNAQSRHLLDQLSRAYHALGGADIPEKFQPANEAFKAAMSSMHAGVTAIDKAWHLPAGEERDRLATESEELINRGASWWDHGQYLKAQAG